jgi:radical SAM superfamily enzyme YgiQ (UPF0313 family)
MNIALICNGSEQLGVQYISAYLKQRGHDVRLFMDPSVFNDRVVFNDERLETLVSMRERLVEAVAAWKPDLVGMSVVTIVYPWAKAVAQGIKALSPGTPVIVGGPHAMLAPEVILEEDCFDMVCTGEGEQAMAELADSIAAGKLDTTIADIWFKTPQGIVKNPLRHLQEDLDQLPFPDRSIFEPYFNMSDSLLTMSQRGCIYRCAYCSHNVVRKNYKGKGRYVRRMSPERFIEHLRHFKELYDYKFVRIYDDIFTYDHEWLKVFTPLYKKHISLPFFCLGHPRYLKEEAVRLIKEAGCRWIQVGVESLNPVTRREVLNRPESNREIFEAIRLLEKYELRYELDFIFGLPGDDAATYEMTVDFLKKTKHLNRVSALVLSYLPKTEIIQHSLNNKDISEADLGNISQGLEGCQTDCGSIRTEEKLKEATRYNMLYRLCAFLPEGAIDFLRKRDLGLCIALKPVLLSAIRVLGMDTVDKIFVKYFFRQLFKVVFLRGSYYDPTASRR